MKFNLKVSEYWEKETCGTNRDITDNTEEYSLEWFQRIEDYRYTVEPFILSAAQFARHKGKKILEVGVGAGTDHLQWARAGLECYGVDITEAAVETTRKHLSLHGFQSNLQRVDAETLPFGDDSFDIVYSWGVIHHSEYPDKIVNEIYRVLRPSGEFIGMMYGRHSLVAFKLWVRHALFTGKPWLSMSEVIWYNMESIGTKAYTRYELRTLFNEFTEFTTTPTLTPYDTFRFPKWANKVFPNKLGWFIVINAVK